ncbi:MAG: hypothetical protein U9R19_15970, partial [Bacteroidota bacterium]|nr:hypothetical protein [Bacteroidota bacterium]
MLGTALFLFLFVICNITFPTCSVAEGGFAYNRAQTTDYYNPSLQQFPDFRYVIHYRSINDDLLDFCNRAKIKVLHAHGPFPAYNGLPSIKQFRKIFGNLKITIDHIHKKGLQVVFYIGPVFGYGDTVKRTNLFGFYDRECKNYSHYFKGNLDDPIHWTQRDDKNRIKSFKRNKNTGFYLCVNQPSVRQYTKG